MGGNGNQLQYSCLGNLMDREAWRAIVHVVAESDKTAHACMLIKKLNMIISYNPPNLLPGYTLKIFSYMCKCHYFNAQSKILKQNFQEGKLCVPSFPSISLFGKFIPCLCTCVLSRFSCVWLLASPWPVKPTRFLCLRDSPGKDTGVGYHALLQRMFLTMLHQSFDPPIQVVPDQTSL